MFGQCRKLDRRIETGKPGGTGNHFRFHEKRVRTKQEVDLGLFRAFGNLDKKVCGKDIFDIAVITAPGIIHQPGRGDGQTDMDVLAGRHGGQNSFDRRLLHA